MKKLLLLLLCTCMQAAFAQSGKIDWKADLEFLTKELPEKHCNFFTARSKGEFVSGIEAIKAESERLTDFQVALKTQQLIARFGDSHTMLQFFQLIDQTQILPLGTLWVSDGPADCSDQRHAHRDGHRQFEHSFHHRQPGDREVNRPGNGDEPSSSRTLRICRLPASQAYAVGRKDAGGKADTSRQCIRKFQTRLPRFRNRQPQSPLHQPLFPRRSDLLHALQQMSQP